MGRLGSGIHAASRGDRLLELIGCNVAESEAQALGVVDLIDEDRQAGRDVVEGP